MSIFSHAPLKRDPSNSRPGFDFDFDFTSKAAPVGKTYRFHYYLPHISTSTTAFYTENDDMTTDLTEPNEQAETEALWLSPCSPDSNAESMELPFIAEDDFNYYPEPEELPYHSSDEEWLIETKEREQKQTIGKLRKKKEGQEFWLEKKVMRLVGMFERLAKGKKQ